MVSVHCAIDRPEALVQRASSPKQVSAPSGPTGEDDDLAGELRGLYEQLVAARMDLGAGTSSGNAPSTLSGGELDCALAQLDSAIVAARGLLCSGRMRATPTMTREDLIDPSPSVRAAPA